MYIDKNMDNDLGIGLGISIGIVVIIVGCYLLYKKSKVAKRKSDPEINEKVKDTIVSFINDIILDYYNEYRVNYLAVRFNIKELETTTSYVLKTKRIGSLSSIIDYYHESTVVEYLKQNIINKYDILVPVDDQLEFVTEVSRIEGKIKAVESVKDKLPVEDYNNLMRELEEDMIYYKKKFANTI